MGFPVITTRLCGIGTSGKNFVCIAAGATAFPVHGYARATLDIDLFVRPMKFLKRIKERKGINKEIQIKEK